MFEWMRAWSTRQWVRAAVILTTIAIVLYVFFRTLDVLLPFLLGLFIGYLILPAVNWVTRHLERVVPYMPARLLAIISIYLLAFLLVGGFFTYLVPVVVEQVQELIANREEIAQTIMDALAGLREDLEAATPPSLQQFVRTQLDRQRAQLETFLVGSATGLLAGFGNALVTIFGLFIVPVWLIYVLYDATKFGRGVLGLIPIAVRRDTTNIGLLFDDVVAAYVRGQLLVAAIVGALTGLGLSLLGVRFAALLGIITAIGDLIPTLGPILAAIPTVLIAALQEPILALWALLVLVGVQQFEGAFIGPRIVGESVRLSPAVIIVLLIVAGDLFGLLGLLLVVPIVAFLRDVLRYLLLRTRPEPLSPDGALHQVRKARLGD